MDKCSDMTAKTARERWPAQRENSDLQITEGDPEPEKIMSEADLAMLDAVRDLCGAGVIRDRAFWAAEAARCGSDWPGIHRLRAEIIQECTAAAIERSAWWALERAA